MVFEINREGKDAGDGFEVFASSLWVSDEIITESLILAQNERWRRVLSMQVGRELECLHSGESGERVSNT